MCTAQFEWRVTREAAFNKNQNHIVFHKHPTVLTPNHIYITFAQLKPASAGPNNLDFHVSGDNFIGEATKCASSFKNNTVQ